MKKVVPFEQTEMEAMKRYYDQIPMGICIQQYMETEDGIGDFMPVYANEMFAQSMGIPLFIVLKNTLRSISESFPLEKIREMKEIACEGKKYSGETYSNDYRRYFRTEMYQYQYGSMVTIMTDITNAHISSSALDSVARSYREIYYVHLKEKRCIRIFPREPEQVKLSYQEFLTYMLEDEEVGTDVYNCVMDLFQIDHLVEKLGREEKIQCKVLRKDVNGELEWQMIDVIARQSIAEELTECIVTIKNIDSVARETTDKQKELERAVAAVKYANDSQNRFLVHMSHDLRTPLNGILGMLTLMEDHIGDAEKQKELIGEIRESASVLREIFEDVLNLTRMEAKGLDAEYRVMDLRVISEQLESIAQSKKVRFEVEENEYRYPMRNMMDVYIRQIIYQLLENAVKFNKENQPIKVCIRELLDHEDPTMILFSVEDHGIGMSEEFCEHIFEPFTQEEGGARTSYGGTGLGLAYVKKLVDKMGGNITVKSKKGVGSKFTVILPVEIAQQDQRAAFFDLEDIDAVSLDDMKILVVEDNPVNMKVAKKLLEKNKMQVIEATDGKVALEMFEESQPGDIDMILMDIMMPVMNGLDATEEIRKLNRMDAKCIPIIAVSANALPEDIKASSDAGMNDHVSKPIDLQVLLRKMKNCVKRSHYVI